MREYAHYFLEHVLRSTLALTEARKLKSESCSVSAMDVVYACKRVGKTIYGYGAWMIDSWLTFWINFAIILALSICQKAELTKAMHFDIFLPMLAKIEFEIKNMQSLLKCQE